MIKRVTAADVAARAGCTPAAVSLWINGKTAGRISDQVGERIREAVEALGYVPNRTAQQLSTGQSRQLAFVFPDVWYTFFSYILDGITAEIDESWDLALTMPLRHEREQGGGTRAALQRALRGGPAGLIIASPEREMLDLVPPGLPTVVIDADSAPEHCSLARYDFEPGAAAVAAHLSAAGHERVGYIGLDRRADTLLTRRARLGDALEAHDIRFALPDLLLDNIRADMVADRVSDWLTSDVTAVICGDESLAYGAIAASQRLGRSVPGELSLVSFNDLAPASLIEPSLTSVHMPTYEIGRLAGQMLASRVAGGDVRVETVPTELVVRESTGPRAVLR
ncbi:LacI family DNA-binding transcriptional regulator [Ruicaihuangia caeni]|uniref:LacI family DNA-binding transcriptional regulator n=1 Tax=Ruicaihuangia caeni TaxID=3042517 RepID=A0AAW6T472_9MICO|nr:LacI family DNA-binding transcriptional regulator [Klugiella sp. YN-L-19]MDI2098482.1 LacI family DNA-binding transcriptional regulator [Klugiella sp. YN-L-19]